MNKKIKKITQQELNLILLEHSKWLSNKNTGKRANLSFTDISGLDLRGFILCYANLSHSLLKNTKLTNINLRYANLSYSDFSGAQMSYAHLEHSNLQYANFNDANLHCSQLEFCKYLNTNFSCADLSDVNFRHSNLKNSNLINANLYNACLYLADISNVQNMPQIPSFCPNNGEFIGYSPAKDNYIIKIKILKDSVRHSGTSEWCNCDKAEILEIQNIDGTIANLSKISFMGCKKATYKVGQIIQFKRFINNRWFKGTNGIRFQCDRAKLVSWLNEKYIFSPDKL